MFPENAPRVPLTDSKGYMSREWWRFFGEMYGSNAALEARLLDLDGAILALTAREQYYDSISTEEPDAPQIIVPSDDMFPAISLAEKSLQLLNVPYGAIIADNNTTAETTTDTTDRKIINWNDNKISNHITTDYTTAQLTVLDPGVYMALLGLSWIGTAAKTYYCSIYVNTTSTNYEFHQKMSTAGAVTSGLCFGPVKLDAGDSVSAYHSSPDGGTTFTMEHGQLVLIGIPSLT